MILSFAGVRTLAEQTEIGLQPFQSQELSAAEPAWGEVWGAVSAAFAPRLAGSRFGDWVFAGRGANCGLHGPSATLT